MRVCHIGFNYFPGQGLTIFYEFARYQALQGLDVSVIAPGREGEPEAESIDGVKVYRIPIASIGRLSADRFRFLLGAARILRRQDFDLVHVYAFVGAGLLPWLAGRRRTLWLYDCQTSAIKPPLIRLQNALIRIESWSFDVLTVLSEGIRDIVFGANAPVAAVIPLGADFDRFAPMAGDPALRARYRIPAQAPVLTYCGSMDHNRRLEKLIDAFALVHAADADAVLLMIGDGSAVDDLKRQAHEMGLADRIVFTGYVPYGEIPRHLAISTVALAFVVTDARFQHQPPTKTVEYLAQGLAVVATDTAGNRVFVVNDVNGVLCDDDARAYGQALVDLIRDPERRLRLAAAARESVRAFDWAVITRDRVVPMYRRILA